MAGTDAAGGFAYQHAQAVGAALRLADEPSLKHVRVEAENDAVDLEIWSESGVLVEAYQFKRRNEKYTWGQGEILKILKDWVLLGIDNPTASFAFVTDGRLGRTGRAVRDALKSAAAGDFLPIESLLPGPISIAGRDSLARASAIVDGDTYSALITRAEKRAIALLPNVSGVGEAEERGRWVVLELLNMITSRSGESDPDDRLIAKQEIYDLICTPRERIKTLNWDEKLRSSFLGSVVSNRPTRVLELKCVSNERDSNDRECKPEESIHRKKPDEKRIEEFVSPEKVCVLGGGTGSGKSTSLRMMQARLASTGDVAILVDAEDYVPGRLGALVAMGLNRFEYIGAYPAIGNAVLTDSTATLIIDGVSEVPQQLRDALKEEIQQLLSAAYKVQLVLAGRDVTVLRSILPRKVATEELRVQPLNADRRRALLATVYKVDVSNVTAVAQNLEHNLGDVADNPMMLLYGLRATATDEDAKTPARILRAMVRSISDENGYSNASQYEIGLGVAFSRLLNEGRRYSDSYGWTELISGVARDLGERGHALSAAELIEFGRETGLVYVAQFDRVQPLHDSFADYLSAAALQRSATELPANLGRHDRVRVSYFAELSGVRSNLARQVVSNLPFTAVTVASYEDRRDGDPSWLQETRDYVKELLPTGSPEPRIAYWVDSGHRRVVTFNGKYDGWWDDTAPTDVDDTGRTFALKSGQGPLYVAIRIWHRFLSDLLRSRDRLTAAVPVDQAQTIQLLSGYSKQLQSSMNALVTAMGIDGVEGETLKDAARESLQILLEKSSPGIDERDRPVRYRYLSGLSESDSRVLCDAGESHRSWTGYGRVDSFLTAPPSKAARKELKDEVNKLVGSNWL
ncbi:hypothetical protein [Nocardia wallacei]|uniref:hypothetical protein n=1 Tax=Nocardia wallacei TaxID=480035 RepID=UPI0024549968|nr:hypothetical protein [Nocardia wallacei]